MEDKKEKKIVRKGINYATFELKENISKIIDEANVPLINAQYVLIELTTELANITEQAIKNEKSIYLSIFLYKLSSGTKSSKVYNII